MTQHTPPADEPGHDHLDDQCRPAQRGRAGDRSSLRRQTINRLFELSAPLQFSSTPFAWQHGAHLYLLVSDWTGWVLAELKFVPRACHYVEVRRTHYRWPREAAGALLSRSLTADEATTRKLATDVTTWLAAGSDQLSPRRLDR
jgi:hypothetical protein